MRVANRIWTHERGVVAGLPEATASASDQQAVRDEKRRPLQLGPEDAGRADHAGAAAGTSGRAACAGWRPKSRRDCVDEQRERRADQLDERAGQARPRDLGAEVASALLA